MATRPKKKAVHRRADSRRDSPLGMRTERQKSPRMVGISRPMEVPE